MREGRPSETARIVCLMRALENAWFGEDALVHDEYARLFLPAHYRALFRVLGGGVGRMLSRPAAFIYESVILRSAFMDAMAREHGRRLPVILLGAGFDSRGLRLRESMANGLHEFDFPATQQHKLELLQANGIAPDYARFHAANFAERSLKEIFAAADLAGRAALVIWEGVSMYLEEETVMSVMREVGESLGAGSILVADFWRSSMGPVPISGGPARILFDALFSEPLLFGTSPSALETAAAKQGAASCEIHSIAALRERFGRPAGILPEPMFLSVMRY